MVSCETKTRLAVRRTTVTVEIFNIILFRPKGVDIVGGDINGLSTRIYDENEANVQFLKQDQNTRHGICCFFVIFAAAESLTSALEKKLMLCPTGGRFSQRWSNDPSF